MGPPIPTSRTSLGRTSSRSAPPRSPAGRALADYSFPSDNPVHLATQISQMDYKLKYFEYFGGAVLFSKDQVLATNGYSNNYWDWGYGI